jgi:hypothetical protein
MAAVAEEEIALLRAEDAQTELAPAAYRERAAHG